VTEGDALGLVGRTIAEKYAVERLVGEGGFAVVYRAMHVIWKRPVALKVFKALAEVSEDRRMKLVDEFIQEGTLLADLSARTAAIVQARDIGMLDVKGMQLPYMVLEWLEGATLEEVLSDEKAQGLRPRTPAEAIALLEPAAEALALAHRKGIAHRDVKPANVFILGEPRGESTAKLLDFGIAKVVGDMQKESGTFNKTAGHVTSFTPAYGAPEQFSRTHGATGPWTDVFALALMMVETISGQEPLAGDDVVQLAVASGNAERRPTPRAFGVEVGDELEAVFAKAVAVKPADRWQSAGEFWGALRNAMRMAPMRVLSDDSARSLPGTRITTDPVASSAPTALAGTQPPAASTPSKRAAATTGGAPVGSGKMGLFVGLGLAALAVIMGGVVFFERGGAKPVAAPSPPAPAPSALRSSSPSASSSASAAMTCPPGMLAIPGGSFFMGSDEGLPNEKPAHQVTLDPYCIDEFEVTTERYKACSDAGRCKRASTTNESSTIKTDKERKTFDPLCNVRDPAGRAKHPINCVDWDMADKFCREQGGRLPTEAEWEFAARGPDGRQYPWGDAWPKSDLLNACGKECAAWGAKNGIEESMMYDSDDGFPNTAPVGSFPKGASRYGLKDVVGNVWEWVSDYYGPYAKDEQKNPKGSTAGDERVMRGGAWNGSVASWVRPTFRYKAPPSERSYGIGFRCAK
jgi:formylglycine-generating enzyme required for sulfatase activity